MMKKKLEIGENLLKRVSPLKVRLVGRKPNREREKKKRFFFICTVCSVFVVVHTLPTNEILQIDLVGAICRIVYYPGFFFFFRSLTQ